MVPIRPRAVFLSELAPRWLSGLYDLIGLLAAVPGVVVGLWGLLVAHVRQPR